MAAQKAWAAAWQRGSGPGKQVRYNCSSKSSQKKGCTHPQKREIPCHPSIHPSRSKSCAAACSKTPTCGSPKRQVLGLLVGAAQRTPDRCLVGARDPHHRDETDQKGRAAAVPVTKHNRLHNRQSELSSNRDGTSGPRTADPPGTSAGAQGVWPPPEGRQDVCRDSPSRGTKASTPTPCAPPSGTCF